MNRKTAVIIISVLAIALVAVGAWAVYGTVRLGEADGVCDVYAESALTELVTSLDAMNSALSESRYAVSAPMCARLFADVATNAGMSVTALSLLPMDAQELEKTAGFLNGVGTYAGTLMAAAAEGQVPGEAARQDIVKLAGQAQMLAQEAAMIGQAYLDGALVMDKYGENGDSTRTNTVGWELRRLEEDMAAFEDLVAREPSGGEAGEEAAQISQDEARRNAALFLEIPEQSLKYEGVSGGELPCYYFSISGEGKDARICVTLRAGEIAEWENDCRPDAGTITEDEAAKTASAFLEEHDYVNLKELSRETQGGFCVVTFAREENDIVFLPDEVRVGVALDSGDVCFLDADRYLLGNGRETALEPDLGVDKAAEAVPEELEIKAARLVVVELSTGSERFCYEIGCQGEAGNVIIYVNARTGLQEKIVAA